MNKTSLQENEVRAVSKYIRMSPSKVRRVLRQITGEVIKKQCFS
jgi:ribosomal protein L22